MAPGQGLGQRGRWAGHLSSQLRAMLRRWVGLMSSLGAGRPGRSQPTAWLLLSPRKAGMGQFLQHLGPGVMEV